MAELVAPDFDGYDNAGAVAVAFADVGVPPVPTSINVLMTPESVVDYAGTRSAGGVA